MTNLPFTNSELNEMIEAGYIKKTKHPDYDLFIYNYTPKTQYESMWNAVTMQSRGLILDERANIIARPFTKFFNYGERADQVIPAEPFEVYDKMDGSLGILYWYADQPFIATRGSFAGEQAQRATQMLNAKYADAIKELDRAKTYLFEIIYPANRIVIDYGSEEQLVLLAIIDTQTGEEEPVAEIGFPIVKKYDGLHDIDFIKNMQIEDKEGFIIRFNSSFRIKVKFAEYVRLHKIITQVSSKTIWEYLKEGRALDELLDKVPDEFYAWVKATVLKFKEEYESIESEAKAEFKVLEDRKTTALYYQTCKHPSILFRLFEDKPYNEIIWKMIKPVYERPFKNEIDN